METLHDVPAEERTEGVSRRGKSRNYGDRTLARAKIGHDLGPEQCAPAYNQNVRNERRKRDRKCGDVASPEGRVHVRMDAFSPVKREAHVTSQTQG